MNINYYMILIIPGLISFLLNIIFLFVLLFPLFLSIMYFERKKFDKSIATSFFSITWLIIFFIVILLADVEKLRNLPFGMLNMVLNFFWFLVVGGIVLSIFYIIRSKRQVNKKNKI